jgi:hypothetical protein
MLILSVPDFDDIYHVYLLNAVLHRLSWFHLISALCSLAQAVSTHFYDYTGSDYGVEPSLVLHSA